MAEPVDIPLTSADGTHLRALLWSAEGPAPGLVVVHGAGSAKERHAPFAELARAAGLSVIALDLRGHGASAGAPGPGFVDDVLAAVDHLRGLGITRIGIRGSSLGGFLALHASPRRHCVRAVVAICAARSVSLARRYEADWPLAMALPEAVSRGTGIARGYWHATGDELVPWGHSFGLHELTPHPRRLRVVMGGDHRSLQADPRIHAETIAFLVEHLRA